MVKGQGFHQPATYCRVLHSYYYVFGMLDAWNRALLHSYLSRALEYYGVHLVIEL